MKKTPEERAKATSAAIAIVRKYMTDFTTKELVSALRKAHCPYSPQVPTLLIQKGLITKFGDTYHFPNPEPIHYKVLEAGMNHIAKSALQYTQRSNDRKNNPVEEPTSIVLKEVLPSTDLSDEQVISMLKLKGYKVYKPVIEYEEC